MKRGFWIIIIAIFLAVASAPVVTAGQEEDVEKLIEEGREAYRNRNWNRAVDIFGRVVSLIQNETTGSLAKFIPEPPSGWTGDEIEVQSGSMSTQEMSVTQSSVTRDYHRDSDGTTVVLMISNSPDIYAGYAQMIKSMKGNPMIKAMAKQQGAEVPSIEEKDGWDVMIAADKEDGEISAIFEDAVVNVSGGSRDDSRAIFDLVDLKGLAKLIREQNK
ncbi:MAG: hypothetical protein GF417_01985 [Candidatus Latescibacteria bacterium]|nr:hypothetical protein [bacterium]MBD3423198.1 hypothetical protein [Candidatus Latescibacterota bacterium]